VTNGQWQFWIDRGGTFTDIVGKSPDGPVVARKLLSDNPELYEDAALEGMRRILNAPADEPFPSHRIAAVKMGTTVATNALLERKGTPVVAAITAGLTDQLEIGTQARPDIFALQIVKPEPLHNHVIAVEERVRADGTVEVPLNRDKLGRDLETARRQGLNSIAFLLMHAYAYPEHERQALALAAEIGFPYAVASHDISAMINFVGRGDTTVADAYLTPTLRRYVSGIEQALQQGRGGQTPHLSFMASSGGLMSADLFRGRDAILSGPAGGVVAMVKTAQQLGFQHIVGFDMGGTSTDVSHYAGAFERKFEAEVAGVRLQVPMLDVETIAAGGGSIISFEGARLQVGPESAGADPGPACYGRGGPLTVTDANVLLGKISPEAFPRVFGPDGNAAVDVAAAKYGFSHLATQMGPEYSPYDVADGAIRIAVESMANAIKKISIGRGYVVSDAALQCFGSAAGQHVCRIADTLDISTVLVHPFSGLLSAYGMGVAPLRSSRQKSIEQPLTDDRLTALVSDAQALTAETVEELIGSGLSQADIVTHHRVHLKYAASDSALPVSLAHLSEMRCAFETAHAQHFGFTSPEKTIEIATLDVESYGGGTQRDDQDVIPDDKRRALATDTTDVFSDGNWRATPVFRRDDLSPGDVIDGPAIVTEDHQTTVIEPLWEARMTDHGMLVVTRSSKPVGTESAANACDPVMLEVFNNKFVAIAEQMGEVLRATAQSVNIKERLDFSCAIFDADGGLVANAPHVPVHLGSMDRSVMAVVDRCGSDLSPGDVYMINAPYDGGTHLPDITVVSPVFDDSGRQLRFFVASRGHHADIGGLSPGSMSPNATSIDEEGVLIPATRIVRENSFDAALVRSLLEDAPYPARNPEQNIADLKAQIAANTRGIRSLNAMLDRHGQETVSAYMGHVQDNGELAMRELIDQLEDGSFEVQTDQGAIIRVAVTVNRRQRSAHIDFTGTSPQQANNFNAPEPVTRAAVLYVLRVMLNRAIPINAGCLRPIKITIPDGSILKPRPPAAVVAGNVEVSQQVTNALFAAFSALSSSQGTMNNLTFGDATHQYYETICSGSPAGPGFDGVGAVQVHMTNTRLTDPEVLELRYPVVVDAFSICRNSGGQGRWCAGDGTRRVLRFLEPMRAAILSSSRTTAPFGLKGGSPGRVGKNMLQRADGRLIPLSGTADVDLNRGDSIIIETPTGGGYGTRKD
jgi:5-oxoprolinase (ATP-hydrolysing)